MHLSNDKTKVMAAISVAGILVTATFLTGLLSIINSYQPAIAQGNMTGNATSSIGGVDAEPSACALNQTTGSQNATTINATTTTGGGGANQSLSEARLHIEEACIAARNNDTQGVLIHLNLSLNALDNATQANMTTTVTGANGSTTTASTTGGGGTTTGGGGTTTGGGGTTTGGGGTTTGGGGTTTGGGGQSGGAGRTSPTNPGNYGNVVR